MLGHGLLELCHVLELELVYLALCLVLLVPELKTLARHPSALDDLEFQFLGGEFRGQTLILLLQKVNHPFELGLLLVLQIQESLVRGGS